MRSVFEKHLSWPLLVLRVCDASPQDVSPCSTVATIKRSMVSLAAHFGTYFPKACGEHQQNRSALNTYLILIKLN
jgi:hypothetical protein